MTTPGPADSPSGFLRALIQVEGGSISVERFMQEALYHPRFGYYAKRVRTVGREGDFSTSATLHPALGQAIAAWAASHRPEVVRRSTWHLIELGGGSGQLAAEVLRNISWWQKCRLRYHLVEVSEGLRASQRERLRKFGQTVQWHGDLRSALVVSGGCALIYSNEFVDAFPCTVLAHGPQAGNWQEVRVRWPEGAEHLSETLADWQGDSPGTWADAVPAAGQRVEMFLSYRHWLAESIEEWKEGRMLTIDYGDLPAALYRRRPRGTLRAYCRHQRVAGLEVYQRFGQQDLTADVNFADLQRWGETLGLRCESLSSQEDFLRRWLAPRTLKQAESDAALAFLLDPAGAGSAFQVLEQTRRQKGA